MTNISGYGGYSYNNFNYSSNGASGTSGSSGSYGASGGSGIASLSARELQEKLSKGEITKEQLNEWLTAHQEVKVLSKVETKTTLTYTISYNGKTETIILAKDGGLISGKNVVMYAAQAPAVSSTEHIKGEYEGFKYNRVKKNRYETDLGTFSNWNDFVTAANFESVKRMVISGMEVMNASVASGVKSKIAKNASEALEKAFSEFEYLGVKYKQVGGHYEYKGNKYISVEAVKEAIEDDKWGSSTMDELAIVARSPESLKEELKNNILQAKSPAETFCAYGKGKIPEYFWQNARGNYSYTCNFGGIKFQVSGCLADNGQVKGLKIKQIK